MKEAIEVYYGVNKNTLPAFADMSRSIFCKCGNKKYLATTKFKSKKTGDYSKFYVSPAKVDGTWRIVHHGSICSFRK